MVQPNSILEGGVEGIPLDVCCYSVLLYASMCHLFIFRSQAKLVDYPASELGVIQSFLDRKHLFALESF